MAEIAVDEFLAGDPGCLGSVDVGNLAIGGGRHLRVKGSLLLGLPEAQIIAIVVLVLVVPAMFWLRTRASQDAAAST